MKIAILGTGIVGRAHAARLLALGHEVVLGTQNVEKTLAQTEKDDMGNVPFSEWSKEHAKAKLAVFAEAAAQGDMVFNALSGMVAVSVLQSLAKELEGKVLVDIANPLDFSKGMPPTLSVCNTDSLGEQIQRALPKVWVVKAFNTVNALVQVNPKQLASGDHTLFVCGNDAGAKSKVIEMAKAYGWTDMIDVGDITCSRGTEMLLPIWLRLWGALNTPIFNFKIVK